MPFLAQPLALSAVRVAFTDDAAPKEVVVFPPGMVKTTHTPPFLMDAHGADNCIAAFEALGRDLPIDYEHQSLGGEWASPDGTAPAAGFVKELRWDPTRGLVASVEWTERGAGYVKSGEYRYYSPVVEIDDESKRCVRLFSIGLTNDPATIGINPLAAKAARLGRATLETGMDAILKMLGLGADASMDDVRAALNDSNVGGVASELNVDPNADAVLAALAAMMGDDDDAGKEEEEDTALSEAAFSRIASAAGINTPVKTEKQLVAALKAKSDAANLGKTELTKQVTALSNQVAELQTETERGKFLALINGDAHCGKIAPADEEKFFDLYRSDRDVFDTVLKTMPKIADGKAKVAPDGGKGGEDGEPTKHAFMARIDKLVAGGMSRLEAQRKARRDAPSEFEDYRSGTQLTAPTSK